jgi:hypothetical protein
MKFCSAREPDDADGDWMSADPYEPEKPVQACRLIAVLMISTLNIEPRFAVKDPQLGGRSNSLGFVQRALGRPRDVHICRRLL